MACNFLMGCGFAAPLPPHKIRGEMMPLSFCFELKIKQGHKKNTHTTLKPISWSIFLFPISEWVFC